LTLGTHPGMRSAASARDAVELRARREDRSIALVMSRSSALVQRAELESEGWKVEIAETPKQTAA
jgi:hypothetical protein